jgi:hypothetical protein
VLQSPTCSQGGEHYQQQQQQQQQQQSQCAGSSGAAAGPPWMQQLSQELSTGRFFGQLLPAGLHCAVMGVEETDAVQVSSGKGRVYLKLTHPLCQGDKETAPRGPCSTSYFCC